MRKATGLLALCGAALTTGLSASADPTLILDTFGNGNFWGVGSTGGNAGAVGFHGAVGSVKAPSDTKAHAAYAALPFTVSGLPAGQSVVSGINIVFNIQPPAGTTSNIASLYGAIYQVPAGGVAALNSPGVTQVGASFQFDTSNSVDQSDPANGSTLKGNGLIELLPAVNLAAANITLIAGQSYFLVIEPKNGLGPTTNDTLLDYGLFIEQLPANVLKANPNLTNSNGKLSNSYVSVGQAEDTYLQGSNGDGLTLQGLTLGRVPQPAYFGAQISVDAAVGATVTGTVALEGVANLGAISPAAPLGTFHISFRTPGTKTEVQGFDVPLTNLGANGTFTVPGAPTGTFDINIKGSKNLSVTISNVNVSGAVTLPQVTLPAGDTNNDNQVDPTDFGIFVGAYNTDSAVANGGYDPRADLNFDGVVDPTDFGLLVGDYNTTGQ